MFDYTQTALNKVLEDFKRLARGVNITAQLFTIAYLVYVTVARSGFLFVNILLLSLNVAYFVFFIIMEYKRGNERVRRLVKEIYGWSKRGIKLFTIGLTVYALVTVTRDFTPLSMLLLLMMILGLVLDTLFYFIIKFLNAEKDLILLGLRKDFDDIKKPVKAVGNFFKKITGGEIEEEEEPVYTKKELKTNAFLETETQKFRKKRAEEKERKKLERKIIKQAKKRVQDETQRIPAPEEIQEDE